MLMDYLAAFSTLLLLEVILGVDNIIFISILVERLPLKTQRRVRNLGIALAVIGRIGLVFSVSWLMSLSKPLFSLGKIPMSGKDIILFFGGAFLLAKSVHELQTWLSHSAKKRKSTPKANISLVILQIIAIDMVFSFDSVITAVALTHEIAIIVGAIVISTTIMLVLADKIQIAIKAYPGLKLLALLFLILLGSLLIIEGLGVVVDKSYLYTVLAFGLVFEVLHIILVPTQHTPVPVRRHAHQKPTQFRLG